MPSERPSKAFKQPWISDTAQTEKLSQAARAIRQNEYQSHGNTATSQGEGENSHTMNDDVVDAEFSEVS